MLFLFCMEPDKIMTMMDGLDDLTGEEKELLEKGVQAMMANPQAIVMSKSRLKKMNLEVGQKIKLYGLNYSGHDLRVRDHRRAARRQVRGRRVHEQGVPPQGAGGVPADTRQAGEPHPMQDKCVNLIWVKLPNKDAFEMLSAMVNDREEASTTRRSSWKPRPAASARWIGRVQGHLLGHEVHPRARRWSAIMCLVVANAISICVRERRTEMAVLKVLGFQPRHVLLLVLGEAILVGFLAGAMSRFLAWGMLGNFKFQIAFFGAFFVPQEALVYGPLLGMAVSFAGSIGPALTAKNVKVAEVFAKVA